MLEFLLPPPSSLHPHAIVCQKGMNENAVSFLLTSLSTQAVVNEMSRNSLPLPSFQNHLNDIFGCCIRSHCFLLFFPHPLRSIFCCLIISILNMLQLPTPRQPATQAAVRVAEKRKKERKKDDRVLATSSYPRRLQHATSSSISRTYAPPCIFSWCLLVVLCPTRNRPSASSDLLSSYQNEKCPHRV